MNTKKYQDEALDYFAKFCGRVYRLGNPVQAFEETTEEWFKTKILYSPLKPMPEVPYVCLRIPTGGGKTLIGGLAIERINKELLHTDSSLTLWLTPTETIRTQTLRDLKTPGTLLRTMLGARLGSYDVIEIDEATSIQPSTLIGSNVILVATMQSFKRGDTSKLNAYKENGQLMAHFQNKSPDEKGNQSLVDVIRMHRPFVIVDEAHNQGSKLAFDVLAGFAPSAILELTATPARDENPSNVLFSVSAYALREAEMIKLPLELSTRPQWQEVVRDAIECLNQLQQAAQEEEKLNKEYIRPIMLLQAERRDQHQETFDAERVKRILMEDFAIPENQIAIATGEKDEIGDKNLMDQGMIRFVITVDKLREGWNCPFAYVLCTFRPTTSATAVEQILGRILRMPYANRKHHEALNLAYAFATSTNFQSTATSLKDGLVRSGFQKQDVEDLVRSRPSSSSMELPSYAPREVTFEPPKDSFSFEQKIPSKIEKQFETTPEQQTVTIRGKIDEQTRKSILSIFKTEEGKAEAEKAIEALNRTAPPEPTPSERGVIFEVPVLAYRSGDLWEDFEKTHLLSCEWTLLQSNATLDENEFPKGEYQSQKGRFDIEASGQLNLKYGEQLEAQMALFEMKCDWTQERLTAWLERNIYDENIIPDEKAAFLLKAVKSLIQDRGFTIEDLVYRKFRLRNVLEVAIQNAKRVVLKQIHLDLIKDEDSFESKIVEDQPRFEAGNYGFDTRYQGYMELPKHFYPIIGNLKSTGQEFACANFIANEVPEVEFWVRNVERKMNSWSLQTSTDRFYPDFILQLKNGKILVVEHKNERDYELWSEQEKRILGALWEKRSGGKCLFVMTKGEQYREMIMGKIRQS